MTTGPIVYERVYGRLQVVQAPVDSVIGPEWLADPDLAVRVHLPAGVIYRVTGWSPERGGSLRLRRLQPEPWTDDQCPTCGERLGAHTHAELQAGCRRGV